VEAFVVLFGGGGRGRGGRDSKSSGETRRHLGKEKGKANPEMADFFRQGERKSLLIGGGGGRGRGSKERLFFLWEEGKKAHTLLTGEKGLKGYGPGLCAEGGG